MTSAHLRPDSSASVKPSMSHSAVLTRSTVPSADVTAMPIIASWKALRKCSSLVCAAANATFWPSRTSSLRRHEITATMPAAVTKPAWIAAHFHGCAIASGWL